MSRWAQAGLLLVAASLSACGGAVSPPVDGGVEDAGEVTEADWSFDVVALAFAPPRPLEGEMVLELEPGAQGGYHVALGTTFRDISPGQVVTLIRDARLDDGTLVSYAELRTRLVSSHNQHEWTAENQTPLFLCPPPFGIRLDDRSIRLRTRAIDQAGKQATREVLLHVSCGDGAGAASCAQICSGR